MCLLRFLTRGRGRRHGRGHRRGRWIYNIVSCTADMLAFDALVCPHNKSCLSCLGAEISVLANRILVVKRRLVYKMWILHASEHFALDQTTSKATPRNLDKVGMNSKFLDINVGGPAVMVLV